MNILRAVSLGVLLSLPAGHALAAQAGPQDDPKPFGAGAMEQLHRFPMTAPKAPDKVLLLEGLIYRPPGNGPFKTIIVNHGSPRDAKDRRNNGRLRFEPVASWFLAKGWAVVVPMRRGYAASEGEWAEAYGSCENPDFHTAGLTTANDIGAVVKYVRDLPYVDRDHVVVMGQSAGAWGTLAIAGRNLPGVVAAIAMAPGRGSIEEGKNCAPERLVEAAAKYGAKAKTPLMWMNASNDSYFGLPLVKQMVDAFGAGGGSVRFEQLASFGKDGHSLLSEPMYADYWIAPVERFLRDLGEM